MYYSKKNQFTIILLILIYFILFKFSAFSQDTLLYRNHRYTIKTKNNKKTYTLLDSNITLTSRYELYIKVNTFVFRNATYLHDEKLEQMYINADLNRDASLSWPEIESFQKMLVAKYRYFICDTILRPDRFMKYGGGKCDDWALMTAGLLRFWGLEPYIARFGRTKVIGHALCLVYWKGAIPSGYMYYIIDHRNDMPKGNYIPIDYQTVGGLNAVDRRWKISHIYVPEKMYYNNKEYEKTDTVQDVIEY
ncbi:MAG: transglutaminase-like domain-containing protein [Bacteroidales bacterium]